MSTSTYLKHTLGDELKGCGAIVAPPRLPTKCTAFHAPAREHSNPAGYRVAPLYSSFSVYAVFDYFCPNSFKTRYVGIIKK